MMDMIDKIICSFDDLFLGSTLFQHGNKLGNKEPETDGSTLGINDRQIKVRVVFQYIVSCNVCGIKSTGDSCGEAQINDTVACLCIRCKGIFKHFRIDMIGADVTIHVI